MKALGLEVHLLSPALLAAAPPASNLTETLPFIPGNSLRGLLARLAIEKGWKPEDDKFRRAFLMGEGRFGFATLSGAQVLPRSARTCKYTGGFRRSGGHGVRDLLLDSPAVGDGDGGLEGKDRTASIANSQAVLPHFSCASCGLGLDYFEGFYLSANGLSRVKPDTRLVTRTAIDAARGTARSGSLFSERVLEEDQRFVARVELAEDLVAAVEALVADAPVGVVGRGGSRGQGWAAVTVTEPPAEVAGTAADRFRSFVEAGGKPMLVVTMLSDGLFRDHYLRDATAPLARDLEPLGVAAADWQETPAAAFSGQRRIFGFDGPPIHLPRPHRLAVAAGSTFLYFLREGRTNPQLPSADGLGWIGEGAREGYGRAALWHPFHLHPEGESP